MTNTRDEIKEHAKVAKKRHGATVRSTTARRDTGEHDTTATITTGA